MTRLEVTRIAHSCALLDFDGSTVLTDPWFSERPTYHPGEPVALRPNELPALTAVVISHGHYDHCDLSALAAYPDHGVPIVAKRGLGGRIRAAGFPNVTELDPWESCVVDGVTVTAAPARHKVPEITLVLQAEGRTVYFGADTLLIPELSEVAARHRHIDLALVPINGLRIRPMLNKQVVMDAREAAILTGILRPDHAVPSHYAFTGGPLGDRLLVKHDGRPEVYATEAAQRAPDTQVHVLATGQPLVL
jgi:L-ascorbate metabolism protein UlaG (beta-lactamase superfamily)